MNLYVERASDVADELNDILLFEGKDPYLFAPSDILDVLACLELRLSADSRGSSSAAYTQLMEAKS